MPRPSFSTQLFTLWILIAVLCGLLSVAVWLMLSWALSERVVAAKQQAAAACTAVASPPPAMVQANKRLKTWRLCVQCRK